MPEPERLELRAWKGEVGGETLGVERVARRRQAALADAVVVDGAAGAGEQRQRTAAADVHVAEQLDEARRDLRLVAVAAAAQDVPDPLHGVVVVGAVVAPVAHGDVLAERLARDVERPVAGHEEARLGRRRHDGGAQDEQAGESHRTNAPTCRASASRMRIVEMSIMSSGSASGSNQPSSSDSMPHASVPARTAHSKTLLT